MGAAREIFLDDVVLGGAGKCCARNALFIGHRHVKRQQPGRRGIDGHGGVHLVERQPVEKRSHVAEMGNRNADLAHFAARQKWSGS